MKELENYRKFLEKTETRDEIKVLYFGGSITGGGTTYPSTGTGIDGQEYNEVFDVTKDSWRELSFAWLKEKYEKKPGQFKEINAAIGGTGSLFGAIRLSEDALKYKPDFVFVEYAVNDNGVSALTAKDPYSENSLFRSLISIIKRLYEQNPEVVIFMPLTSYRTGIDEKYKPWQDAMQRSADLSEHFCNIFKIPYVSIFNAYYKGYLCENVNKDKLFVGADIPGNAVHPAAHGHQIIAEAVCKTLESVFDTNEFKFKEYDKSEMVFDKDKLTPYPVAPYFVFADKLLSEADEKRFRIIEEGEGHSLINGRKVFFTDDTSFSISYEFNGSMIGAWFDYGSICNIIIKLDGKVLGNWTNNCKDTGVFSGDQYCVFASGIDKTVTHKIEMIPAPEQNLADGLNYRWGVRALFIDV
ncbi:MAG: SGNH/GDSL hydrolase family protein [Saccharofermentanales bacterium]